MTKKRKILIVSFLTVALLFSMSFTTIIDTYAARTPWPDPVSDWTGYELWEDCDWDGYDDHTGKKTPVGFDGTRGDTPEGQTESSANRQNEATAGEGYNFSNSNNSSSSKTKKKTKKKVVKEKTVKKEKTKETKKKNGEEEIKETETVKVKTTTAKKILKNGEVKFIRAAENKKDKTAYVGGETFQISAKGLEKNIVGITIELHSDPIALGIVDTDANGAFTKEIKIPKNAPAGKHDIVLLYKKKEILKEPIVIEKATASDTKTVAPVVTEAVDFVETENPSTNRVEFFAGLALLLLLIILSGFALIGSTLYRRAKKA
jgi:hypothetical protein